MPRKNRRKVHRAQRLAAEQRHAARALARREAQRAHALAERAVARALARRSTVATDLPATASAALTSVTELCRLTPVAPRRIERVQAIVRTLGTQVPSLATAQRLPWYLLLTAHPWQRPLAQWRPPSGSERRKADALATHLLARYPVPPFLLRALDCELLAVARVPEEDAWAVGVLAWVGAGHSLAKAPPDVLPTPLTRRMVHRFLSATARTAPLRALRSAQLHGHGAPPRCLRAVMATRLAVLRGPDARVGEPFWDRILAWYAARPELHDLDGPDLERLFAWLEAEQRVALADDRTLALKGRPVEAVLQQANAWHAERRSRVGAFPASGLAPWAEGRWSLVELDSAKALRDEGRAMAHCVATYVGLARKRRVSLWSLRLDGHRHGTVEVALPTARIVQAKGKANRALDAEARQALRRWARTQRLTLAC